MNYRDKAVCFVKEKLQVREGLAEEIVATLKENGYMPCVIGGVPDVPGNLTDWHQKIPETREDYCRLYENLYEECYKGILYEDMTVSEIEEFVKDPEHDKKVKARYLSLANHVDIAAMYIAENRNMHINRIIDLVYEDETLTDKEHKYDPNHVIHSVARLLSKVGRLEGTIED